MEIYYGICGEGLGHVGRACRIIKELKNRNHNVYIFTYGEAYDFLVKSNKYNQWLNCIDGLCLIHKRNRVSTLYTIKNFVNFVANLHDSVYQASCMVQLMAWSKNKKPDLFITDFEPITPRVAKVFEVPCISIDNQHKLMFDNDLPINLKVYCRLAKLFIQYYIPTKHNIITTFHKTNNTTTHIVLRQEIIDKPVTNNGHVLVYLKDAYFDTILPYLCNIDRYIIVYGPKKRKVPHHIIQKPISNDTFVQDLVSCDRIVSHAGNQLICEAKFLQKPILVVPIKNQTEQMVNAFYVKQDNLGTYCSIYKFSDDIIRNFLQQTYQKYVVNDDVPNIIKQIEERNWSII